MSASAIKSISSLIDIHELKKHHDVKVIDGVKRPEELIKPFSTATECLVGFGVWNLGWCPGEDLKLDANGNFLPDPYVDVLMKYGDKVVFSGTEENIRDYKSFTEKFPIAEGKFLARWVDPELLQITTNMEFFDDITLIFYPVGKNKKLGNFYAANAYMIKNRYLAQTLRSISFYIWENANSIA